MTLPFSAIVGQSDIKTALMVCAVAPQIGGVLILGRRGTAKSTTVRSLPQVLSELSGIADCPYFCDPNQPNRACSKCASRIARGEELPLDKRTVRVVNLPLNASEDRLVGCFDLSAALSNGWGDEGRVFRPGILAEANRNILYVDEVNLLADHLVDSLLDAAALGVNFVEREGVSEMHPARFTLVGTMNPEEGELRPQLLDRFGLAVTAETIRDLPRRTLIAKRVLSNDNNPVGLKADFSDEETQLRKRIERAIELYPNTTTPMQIRLAVSQIIGQQMKADGHRGDIVVDCTARALAALDGRLEATLEDAELALRLAMGHRVKELPNLKKITATIIEEQLPNGESPDEPTELAETDDYQEIETVPDEKFQPGLAGISRKIKAGQEGFPLHAILDLPRDRHQREYTGKRFLSRTKLHSGRYVRSQLRRPVTDLALDATLRAAAPHQKSRGWQPGTDEILKLHTDDFRQKVRQRKSRALLVFAIDASDSVMSKQLMLATKRAILALLQDVYEKRDQVALITFRFAQARVVLPPTNNMTRAREAVEQIYVGGCTPIATGILESLHLIEKERRRNPTLYPALLLFTDGLPNVGLNGNMNGDVPVFDALRVAEQVAEAHVTATVIDTGPHFAPKTPGQTSESICKQIAERMNGRYYVLSDLKKENVFEEAV